MLAKIKDFEEGIVSTVKAMCGTEKLDIDFDAGKLYFSNVNQNSFNKNRISLPQISSQNDFEAARAFGDLAAFYLKFHNQKIHQTLSDQDSQKLFESFEKIRVICEGSKSFKGSSINIESLIDEELDVATDYSFLPFLLLKNPSLQTRVENLRKIIGKDLLKKIDQLDELTFDQKRFAQKSLEIIEFLNEQKKEQNQEGGKSDDQKDPEPQNQESEDSQSNEENVEAEVQINKSKKSEQNDGESSSGETQNAKIFEEIDQEMPGDEEVLDLGSNESKIKFVPKYKIFSKKFDQIVRADDLMSHDEAENLRNQLDLKIAKLERISKQLTAKLKRKLLAKKQIFFEFDKEEGLLDPKKIPQIIISPLFRNNYLTVQENDYQNTILSILIDNSGSMRGTPIVMSAMAAEMIAKIFEGFGIKTEILGFTTVDWRGGKSRKLWEESGKPKNPGRLSDTRHIIYKHANQSFKKSRNNLALMLKDGTLKENIDGEALIWAATRLKNRTEKRKILLVISDGTPVDDATNSNNDSDILNDHLHQTITQLEKHSKIEIAAIGIGHNVGDFYQNSIVVKNIEELGDVMVNKICDLL
ncbi:MAG: cobaltochelatase CobT [Rickettsiales bacterium]|jgi:cobaltochelatase CobT